MSELKRYVPEQLQPYQLRAVIWDKDGPLMDTEPLYFKSILKILGQRGISEYDWDEHQETMGFGGLKMFDHIMRKYGFDAPVELLRNEHRKNYYDLMEKELKIQDGVEEILCQLEAAGIPSLVATGASRGNAELSLRITGIQSRFSHIVSNDDVLRGKPSPDIFLEAARRQGVKPEHCLVIGDSWNDLLGAKRAGMKMALLTQDKNTVKPVAGIYPDLVVESIKALSLDSMANLWTV